MKTCPVCQRYFEDSVQFCPEKHGSLVAASFPEAIGERRLETLPAGEATEKIHQVMPAISERSFDETGEAAFSVETPAPTADELPFENYQPAENDIDKNVMPLLINQLDVLIPSEKAVESPLGTVTFPGWSSPMPFKKEKSDDDFLVRESNTVESKETSLASFDSSPILVERKQSGSLSPKSNSAAAEVSGENKSEFVAVAPAEAIISPTVAKPDDFPAIDVDNADRRQSLPTAPIRSRENVLRTRPRKSLAANRNQWLVGAALIALVTAAGLGMFLYNRLNQPPNIEQATVEETPVAAAPTPFPSADTGENTVLNAEPETTETGESAAPGASQGSPSTDPKSETQNQKHRKTTANDGAVSPRDSTVDESARENPAEDQKSGETESRENSRTGNEQTELNASLDQWISATNNRDIERQMDYYAPQVNAYYRVRNASPDLVRAEKKRIFERASVVEIQTDTPEISVSRDGQNATMRFRKKYAVREGQKNRRGEVIQELQWIKSGGDWKIVSERDVKVIKR